MKSERMKRFVTGLVALIFGVAVIGFTIKLTYDTMAILFPQDVILRWISIALYDGGVMAWLTTYIGRAKGTPQRGISLVMTVSDFLGVVAMVIAGIYLSGQSLADIPPWVGSAVVNVTIIAATLNAGAIYYYHANAPDVTEAIQAQELEDDLNEEALNQARFQVERSAQQLGAIIANRVTARLKYRLRLPMTETEAAEWRGEVIDAEWSKAESYNPAALPPPPVQQETFWSAVKSFFGGRRSQPSSVTQPSKNSTALQQDVSQEELEKIAATSNDLMAWRDDPQDGRRRWWCKICRDEGHEWLTPMACDHILNAQPERTMTDDEAQAIWQVYNENYPVKEPAGATHPTYHPVSMEQERDPRKPYSMPTNE